MEKQRFNKTSYKDMIRKAQEIHFNSLYAKCMAMDFAFITYNDLLRYIISDVDLIYIFERAISENTIENQFFTNVKGTDLHEYNNCFKEWYDSAFKELIEMMRKYKFFDI